MNTLKFIGTFLGGFICASLLFVFLIMPADNRAGFDFGYTNGITRGHLDAVDAIQKEFGTFDDGLQYKVLLSVGTSDVVSMETNGVKSIRVIP